MVESCISLKSLLFSICLTGHNRLWHESRLIFASLIEQEVAEKAEEIVQPFTDLKEEQSLNHEIRE